MNPFVFNPVVEYEQLDILHYTNLGSHICDCSSATTDIENKILHI